MKRRVIITYFAHLHWDETVTWEREEYLAPDEDRDGPGHNLASTPATGITVNGSFYPFSSIRNIDWKVEG